MTMLPISPEELRNPTPREFLERRERLYKSSTALALARTQPMIERQQRAVIIKVRINPPDRVAGVLARAARKFPALKMPVKQSIIVRKVLVEVGLKHGFRVAEIVGPSRKHPLVHVRQEAMYRLATELALSYSEIGRQIGGRDHSTAFSGVRSHAKRKGLPVPDRARAAQQ